METIGLIPFVLDPVDILKRLRFDSARAGFESLDKLVDLAQRFIQPAEAYDDPISLGARVDLDLGPGKRDSVLLLARS